jgi:hypothetical protein
VEAEAVETPVPALVGAAEANGTVSEDVAAAPAASSVRLAPVGPPAGPALPTTQPEGRPTSMALLYIWIALFGFVGTQLAWTLRPFFGSPGEPFALFRDINGTFYGDIFATIGRLFGG